MWQQEFCIIEKQMSYEIGEFGKLNEVSFTTPTRGTRPDGSQRDVQKSIIWKLLIRTGEILAEMRKDKEILEAFGSNNGVLSDNIQEKRKFYLKVYEYRTKMEIAMAKFGAWSNLAAIVTKVTLLSFNKRFNQVFVFCIL